MAVITDKDGSNAVVVSTAGALTVTGTVSATASATATITTVSVSTTTAAGPVSNASRKGLLVQNEGTGIAYLAFAATATTTAYTLQIPSGGYFEMLAPIYTGATSFITASGTATVRVTELT